MQKLRIQMVLLMLASLAQDITGQRHERGSPERDKDRFESYGDDLGFVQTNLMPLIEAMQGERQTADLMEDAQPYSAQTVSSSGEIDIATAAAHEAARTLFKFAAEMTKRGPEAAEEAALRIAKLAEDLTRQEMAPQKPGSSVESDNVFPQRLEQETVVGRVPVVVPPHDKAIAPPPATVRGPGVALLQEEAAVPVAHKVGAVVKPETMAMAISSNAEFKHQMRQHFASMLHPVHPRKQPGEGHRAGVP